MDYGRTNKSGKEVISFSTNKGENKMAYMSQEHKKKITPQIKKILKKYGMKGSVAVYHYSTLVVNIKSGVIDFDLGEKVYRSISEYWIEENYTGIAREFLRELVKEMNMGNHDRSDIQTDYVDVGWYITINIGQWDKPYKFV